MSVRPEILHYVGYDDDRGGIVSVVHHLAGTGRFDGVLGVNPGCVQRRSPPLPVWELPRLAGEKITLPNFWRARGVARIVQAWLRADIRRVYHGHSRAGLLVALWLHRWGERRVVASVHCYGRQRWFYRWAARQLGSRLFWLSPAMRTYYGAPGTDWTQCVPECVPAGPPAASPAGAGRLRLGGVGTLVRWKQWELIVQALALLPEPARSRVSFTHIGEGDAACLADLRARVREAGLSEVVAFAGPEASSRRLLGEIDVLVVASRYEPFSVAMLEALAAGVPVLAADSGGATDVIRDGINGRLFRTGDASALAGLIQAWVEHPPGLDREQIRRTAFYAEDLAARWVEIYSAL